MMSLKTAINSVYADIFILNVNKNSSDDKESAKHYQWRLVRQKSYPDEIQSSVVIFHQAICFMT